MLVSNTPCLISHTKSPRDLVGKVVVQEKSDCGNNSNGCVEGM